MAKGNKNERTPRQQWILGLLLRRMLPYKHLIIIGNLLGFIAGILGVFNIVALKPILDVIFLEKPTQAINYTIETKDSKFSTTGVASENSSVTSEVRKTGKESIPIFRDVASITNSFNDYFREKKAKLYDYLFADKIRAIYIICAVILGASLLRGIFLFTSNFCLRISVLRMLKKLAQDVFNHIVEQDHIFFHKYQTGQLMSRVYNEVRMLGVPIMYAIGDKIQAPVTVLILLVTLLMFSAKLTGIVIFFAIITAVPVILLGTKMREVSRKIVGESLFIMDLMHEVFASITQVKASIAEEFEKKQFEISNELLYQRRKRRQLLKALSTPVVELLSGFSIAVILVIGASAILRHHMISGSDFIVFLLLLTRFYNPVKTLSKMNLNVQRALASGEAVIKLLEETPKITDAPDAIEFPQDWKIIKIENVSFTYPKLKIGKKKKVIPGRRALKRITFWLPRGTKLAVAGHNGSGKSTLASLLCRFYDPDEGSITIDDIDIRKIRLKSLRERIGLLPQRPYLFNRSIYQNIAYGMQDVPMEKVQEAARLAGIAEFIESLPEKYNAIIGERGGSLSLGQQKKLALARILLRDPEVIILDEPTESLDQSSREDFKSVLKNILKDKTCLIISHDKDLLDLADKIVYLKKGEIARIEKKTPLPVTSSPQTPEEEHLVD